MDNFGCVASNNYESSAIYLGTYICRAHRPYRVKHNQHAKHAIAVFFINYLCNYVLGLSDSTIVIHCRDTGVVDQLL